MNRKQFLTASALGGGALITSPFIVDSIKSNKMTKHNYAKAFGMARSLRTEGTYKTEIEGKLPREITGTLYRNGPGLFERNGYRKSNILDGDGMVQAFRFENGQVHYRNRFVRTVKWLEEEVKGKYLYNTWTTRRPGGMLKNAFMQGKFGSQAGVSVKAVNSKLFAFDESSLPYELDPLTLETLKSEVDFGVQFDDTRTLFAAHSKIDGHTGDWIQFGLSNGPKSSIQVSIFDSKIRLKRKNLYKLPLGTYMHDFFVSSDYLIFNLQPAEMNPLSFITGFDSFAESLRWKGEKGSTFMIVHKSLSEAPVFVKADSVFMWHSLNAFQKGEEIICYFCGYDNPDHFIGDHAQTYRIMRPGATPNNIPDTDNPGTIRMARINLRKKTISTETLSDLHGLSYEFPIMNDQFLTREHSIGYFASGNMNGAFHHQISRMNLKTGRASHYDYGEGKYCGEPIFVPNSELAYTPNTNEEEGWLMSLVFDESEDKSFLAVMNANNLEEGPLAKVHLAHHSPMSFHGTWSPLT